jgi:mRNA interferase MazF
MKGFKRWDVVKIPHLDGSKPAHRPALVIVAGELLKCHGLLWVVMITSARHRGWPGDIEVQDLMTTGLGVPSIVRTAKIMTVEAENAELIGGLLGPQRREVSAQVFANMGLAGVV